MKTSQPIEAIGFLHPKTGYEIPVRIRAVPAHNQHGSVIGAVETFEDSSPPPMFAIATMDRSFPVASTDQVPKSADLPPSACTTWMPHSILPNRRISSYRPIHHKKGDEEDDKPAASKQKPEPVKTPPAQEQPAAKEKRIGRKR
jgi:hypothetical protein